VTIGQGRQLPNGDFQVSIAQRVYQISQRSLELDPPRGLPLDLASSKKSFSGTSRFRLSRSSNSTLGSEMARSIIGDRLNCASNLACKLLLGERSTDTSGSKTYADTLLQGAAHLPKFSIRQAGLTMKSDTIYSKNNEVDY
jgi:hypothetical protein